MKMKNENSKIYSLLAFIINILAVIVSGLALSLGWNTFVLRIFDLPHMGMWTAIGLSFVVELVRVNLSRDVYYTLKTTDLLGDSVAESRMIMALTALTFSLVSWFGIFIVSLF